MKRYVGPYFTPDYRVDLGVAQRAIDAVAAELDVAPMRARDFYECGDGTLTGKEQ